MDPGLWVAIGILCLLGYRREQAYQQDVAALEKRLDHLEQQCASGFQATAEAVRNNVALSLKVAEMLKLLQDYTAERYLKKTDLN
jgi:hypothetical protein